MFLQERERKSKRSLWVSKSAWEESSGEWVDIWGKFRTLVSHPCSLWLGFQWDEALLTMSKGETASLEIDPEWAYGKKGVPDSKYPFPGLDLMHAAAAGVHGSSFTQILSEFLPMQSCFLKLNWLLWTEALNQRYTSDGWKCLLLLHLDCIFSLSATTLGSEWLITDVLTVFLHVHLQ